MIFHLPEMEAMLISDRQDRIFICRQARLHLQEQRLIFSRDLNLTQLMVELTLHPYHLSFLELLEGDKKAEFEKNNA